MSPRRLTVFLAFLFAFASAQQFATRQLVLDLEGSRAYLNGAPVTLLAAARVVDGRALLPVREVARALGLALEPVGNGSGSGGGGFRLGKLEVYPGLRLARLDGRQVGLEEVGAVLDGVVFVSARALETALGLGVAFDPAQRLLTLTYAPGAPARDTTRPVARFATDKREYRVGEPVRIIEYSYDPDGQPVSLSFSGRDEVFAQMTPEGGGRQFVFFTPGPKDLTLVATNRQGRASEPFTVRVFVRPEVFATPRDYALRHLPLGRVFPDPEILSYPALAAVREDTPIPLIFSDSPEEPKQSGVLYTDALNGPARLLAYHINALPTPARLMVLATNLEPTRSTVQLSRLGETSATRVVSVLGQVSLMDFLTSSARDQLVLEPGQTMLLYSSALLNPGQGLNLMADLHAQGNTLLVVAMVEQALVSPDLEGMLASLSVLDPDGVHVRGTFPGAVRTLRVRMLGNVGRVVLGDGLLDPRLSGVDAITLQPVTLAGNYGVTYRIVIEGASGTAVAFSPRGGMYSGAISVEGLLTAVPGNGVLYRPDYPMLLHRETQDDRIELEFTPASGSFLPVNLVLYRLDPAQNVAQGR